MSFESTCQCRQFCEINVYFTMTQLFASMSLGVDKIQAYKAALEKSIMDHTAFKDSQDIS